MRRIDIGRIVLPLVVAAFCCPAWAQAQKKAAAKPKPAPEAAKETATADKVAATAKKSRRSEDARACLEKSSNTEIIKCAEAYL